MSKSIFVADVGELKVFFCPDDDHHHYKIFRNSSVVGVASSNLLKYACAGEMKNAVKRLANIIELSEKQTMALLKICLAHHNLLS